MLSWIPILGPIIQGLVSIWSKSKDTQVAILKTNRDSDVAEAQVSADIIRTTQDDIGLRLMRDIYCFPAVVHASFVSWDTLIAENSWSVYMWHVAKYPPSMEWYPYTVAVFLLGNIGLNMWNRK